MKTLVIGGGGFLGKAIALQLAARGDDVTVFGRNKYPKLEKLGIKCLQGDICEIDSLQAATEGMETVFHSAAVAGIWGKWKHYHTINTIGTRNVVDTCVKADVEKLIFTSSPSVVYNGTDQRNVDESAFYPKRWLCHYPRSKALAEQHVLDSHDKTKLLTCALRPHLIWGPGDPHLVPRMIERAKLGKLKRVGNGQNKVDMIYVDNAAAGHLQAADALTKDSPVGGKAYFLSDGDPIPMWTWINEVLEIAGVSRIKRSVSFKTAYNAGFVLEKFYEMMGWWDSEPVMTRFLACQLATDHYYNISAAKRDFGYQPIVSYEQAMENLGQYLIGESVSERFVIQRPSDMPVKEKKQNKTAETSDQSESRYSKSNHLTGSASPEQDSMAYLDETESDLDTRSGETDQYSADYTSDEYDASGDYQNENYLDQDSEDYDSATSYEDHDDQGHSEDYRLPQTVDPNQDDQESFPSNASFQEDTRNSERQARSSNSSGKRDRRSGKKKRR